ncbi:MAG: DciA family protein [Planctomycetia bacterium]
MKKIGDILGRVLVERGLTQVTARLDLERCWTDAVAGRWPDRTKVGALRWGVLEILVDNSTLLQELEGFHKESLLAAVRAGAGIKHPIASLRFRRM